MLGGVIDTRVFPDSDGTTQERDFISHFYCIYTFIFVYFFGGLEFVGHSFANFAHFVFLRDVWIRTQRAAVTSRRTTNLAFSALHYFFEVIFAL
jgi:hypothetical protein